jgi:hypothetical protein
VAAAQGLAGSRALLPCSRSSISMYPSRLHHRAYVFDGLCVVPLDLLWSLCASLARCGLEAAVDGRSKINSSMSMARKSPAARTYHHHRHPAVVSESILVHGSVRVVWCGGAGTKTSNTQRPPSPWAEQGREASLYPFDHHLRTQSYSLNGKRYTVSRTRSCVCSQNGCAGRSCRRVRSKVSSQQPLCEDLMLFATIYQPRTRPLSEVALSRCTMPLPLPVLRFSVPM